MQATAAAALLQAVETDPRFKSHSLALSLKIHALLLQYHIRFAVNQIPTTNQTRESYQIQVLEMVSVTKLVRLRLLLRVYSVYTVRPVRHTDRLIIRQTTFT